MRGSRGSVYVWVLFVVVSVVALVVVYLLMGKSFGDALILAGVAVVGATLGVCLREVFRGKSRRRTPEGRHAQRDADLHD